MNIKLNNIEFECEWTCEYWLADDGVLMVSRRGVDARERWRRLSWNPCRRTTTTNSSRDKGRKRVLHPARWWGEELIQHFFAGETCTKKAMKNECWLSSTSLLTARCGARLLSVQDCRRLSPSTTSAKKKKYFLRTGQTNYWQKYSSPKTLSQMFPIASPYAIAYSETKDAEELARVKEQTFDVVSRITGLPFNTYCHN